MHALGLPGIILQTADWTDPLNMEKERKRYQKFSSRMHICFLNLLRDWGLLIHSAETRKKAIEIGNTLVDYGKKHSNIRSLTMGYAVSWGAYNCDNDLTTAIEAYEKAIQVGVEPFYVEYIRMNLALVYIMNGQITEAENAFNCVVAF